MGIYDWSRTAADNGSADGTINWQEQQTPSSVNDSARALMARVADFRDDWLATQDSTGAENTYKVRSYSWPGSLVDGFTVTFFAHQANTGASQIQIANSAGVVQVTKNMRAKSGVNLVAGEVQALTLIVASYRQTSDEFLISNSGLHVNSLTGGTLSEYVTSRLLPLGSVLWWPYDESTIPAGFVIADNRSLNTTTYASYFAIVGYMYGGSGSSFKTIDMRGYTPRGVDGGAGVDPDAASRVDRGDGTTGDAPGTIQGDQYREHLHSAGTLGGTALPAGAHKHTYPNANNTVNVEAGSGATVAGTNLGNTSDEPNHTHTLSISGSVNNSGGNETRGKNRSGFFIVFVSPEERSVEELGSYGIAYRFADETADADPGSGYLRLNNASLASVTELYISDLDLYGSDLSSLIDTWDDASGANKGILRIWPIGQPATFAHFRITGALTTASGYRKATLTYIAHGGALTDGMVLQCDYTPYGEGVNISSVTLGADNGDGTFDIDFNLSDATTQTLTTPDLTGPQGDPGTDPGYPFTFSNSTNTTADPGTGGLRLNNATLSSVTEISVDDQCTLAGNPDISAHVATWDDSTSTIKGTLRIVKPTAPSNFAEFSVTALVDATTHHRVTVTHVTSNGAFSDTDSLSVQFVRNGDGGGGGGSVTSVFGRSGAVTAASGDYDDAQITSAASATNYTPAASNVDGHLSGIDTALAARVPLTREVNAGTGLSGGGALTTDRSLSLANTAVTPGAYTSANITVDAQGRITSAANGTAGAAPTVQIFTGSGTWTKPSGCKWVRVTVVGGGGAGGGAVAVTTLNNQSGGAGGCAGGVTVQWANATGLSSETVTIGAAGAGSAGAAGGNGGQSSFTISGGTTVTAPGGNGGDYFTNESSATNTAATGTVSAAGNGDTTGSNEYLATGSSPGGFAIRVGTEVHSGSGGNTPFGSGGAGIRALNDGASAAGASGTGYGAGGGGAANDKSSANQPARAGGDGTAGIVIVEEFY